MFGTELLSKVNFPIPDNAQKNVVETKGKTKKNIQRKQHKGTDDTHVIVIQPGWDACNYIF